ncbi:MAG: hypothetical protein AGIKBDMD_01889 [Synergistaceae bacterium]
MSFIDYVEINPSIKLEKGKEYPFIEMSSVDFYAREPQQIDIKEYSSGVKFQRGDTVISRIEPCLQNGKSFFVKNISEGFGSTEFLVFRPKDKKVNNEFLYYFLLTDGIRKSMINSMTGATGRQRVNNDIFKSLEISLPSIKKQERIANILSTYDDLIENNQKQIKLLEEAAMRLYKEWFVNLRFPGYETTKIVDGVPEGWNKVTVNNALAYFIGGGWGKEAATGKHLIMGKVIRGTDINNIKKGNFLSVPLRYHTANDITKRKLESNDMVFEISNGKIDNIGRCLFVDDLILSSCGTHTICASFCKLLRPKNLKTAVTLYYEINNMQLSGKMLPLKKNGTNGINNFDFDGFLAHEFLLPDNDKLVGILCKIMGKISNIQKRFFITRNARDKLLPKLISGEIKVPEEEDA